MMTASAPSMTTVFWWVYWYFDHDQTTLTPCDVRYWYAPELTLSSRLSSTTRTRTPLAAASARPCSAVPSENSYMVTSMLCRARSMRLYTGENPALGSMISGPATAAVEGPLVAGAEGARGAGPGLDPGAGAET